LAVENGLRMVYWARLVIPVSSFAAILVIVHRDFNDPKKS
jgi:hypothetical protein